MGFNLGSLGSVVYDIVSQDKTKEGVDSAIGGADKLDQKWNDMATTGLGLAGVGIAVGVMMWGVASRAADLADQLDDLSKVTGMSTDELQEMRYVVGNLGGDFSSVTSAISMMLRNLGTSAMTDANTNMENLGKDLEEATARFEKIQKRLTDLPEELSDTQRELKGAVLDSADAQDEFNAAIAKGALLVRALDQVSTIALANNMSESDVRKQILDQMHEQERVIERTTLGKQNAADREEDIRAKIKRMQEEQISGAKELATIKAAYHISTLTELTALSTSMFSATGTMERLGVSVTDAAGKARPTIDIFRDVVDALGKIEDPMQRAAIASGIFGKSYKPVLEMVGTSKEDWDKMAKAARDAGFIIGTENVQAATAFKKSQSEVNMAMDTFWNELGLAVMPLLRELPGLLNEVKPAIDAIAWVLRNALAFNYLMESGEKLITGDVAGAQAAFAKGQITSQGTAAQAATAGSSVTININNPTLSKGYTAGDAVRDAAEAARNERVQSGVPS